LILLRLDEARLSQLKRRLATKLSESDQIARFTGELQEQIAKLRGASRRTGTIKNPVLEIKQQQRSIEECRALGRAKEQLRSAESVLKSVQNRQQRLYKRSM